MPGKEKHSDGGQLQRRLGLAALVFYGVGDILGAGIYALVGEIAGIAGEYSWLAFLVALIVASFTGLTYAELGGRFPRSGGESHFCQQAFRSPRLSQVIGWLVFCSGLLSLSTISRAFAGYVVVVHPDIPVNVVVVSVLVTLAAINFVGIHISSAVNIVCTLIEASGLLLVICLGSAFLFYGSNTAIGLTNIEATPTVVGGFAVLQAASLAFFAFVGFEDLVNVAEEARNPKRDMPLAIVISAGIAAALYIIVIVVATNVVSPAELAASRAPLLRVVEAAAPWFPAWLFTGIALFAVANTGLLNFITASRLLYGMSRDRLLPSNIGQIHQGRRTPHRAILIVLVTAVILATTGSLSYLAGTTSVLLLCVFLVMNLSLYRVKRSVPADGSFSVPALIPAIGAIVCVGLLACTPLKEVITAAAITFVGFLLTIKFVSGRAE